ncbi:MAG TPA: hypothetical protein VF571_18325, partial [Pyrinomonadaceae bacterium]
MRLRIIVSVAAVWILGAIIASSFWVKTSHTQESKVKDFQLPVTVKQLELENSTIPVELKCGYAELSAQNSFEKVPCLMVNNTNKYITAIAVNFTVILEESGKTYLSSNVIAIETMLDVDLREERKSSFIAPKGESRINPLPTQYSGNIKEIIMQIDYVEFEDNTSLGANISGSQTIGKIREGAKKYKEWLIKKYNERDFQDSEIVNLLGQRQPIPEELNLSSNAWEGAFQYRNFLRRTYENEGKKGLDKRISK